MSLPREVVQTVGGGGGGGGVAWPFMYAKLVLFLGPCLGIESARKQIHQIQKTNATIAVQEAEGRVRERERAK